MSSLPDRYRPDCLLLLPDTPESAARIHRLPCLLATEEKEEKTEVYQNKANDYAILLPEQMSEENGVTIENGKTRIRIIPVDGDYTHSVIKDNAILYNEVYEGADEIGRAHV